MADFTVTMTSGQETRVEAALAEKYTNTTLGRQTLAVQVQQFFYESLKELVRDYETRAAARIAKQAISTF